MNLLEIDSEEYWTSKPDQAGDLLKYRMRIKGVFTARFHLKKFPFDVQQLSITFELIITFLFILKELQLTKLLTK